jgi:cyclase
MRKRLIPVILKSDHKLVKTTKFKNPRYVGDPRNTVSIFSDFQVDELIVLDVKVSKNGIDFDVLRAIAAEAHMPIAYGGGISSVEDVGRILSSGFEKVVLNTAVYDDPHLVEVCASTFGSQAITVSIDVRIGKKGYSCHSHGGRVKQSEDPIEWAKQCSDLGAGELLLTVIEREGTWRGIDLDFTQRVSESVDIPVIAHGGIGSIQDVRDAYQVSHISAVAAGSFFVYQDESAGVLVSYPEPSELDGM